MKSQESACKDLQDGFEKIQRDYRRAMEDAFVIQKLSLEFARTLLESSTEALREQAEENYRKTLIALSVQSNRARDALEDLLRESARAYTKLLQASFCPDGRSEKR